MGKEEGQEEQSSQGERESPAGSEKAKRESRWHWSIFIVSRNKYNELLAKYEQCRNDLARLYEEHERLCSYLGSRELEDRISARSRRKS